MPEREALLLSYDEVKKLLGGLSRSTLRRLVLRGDLKAPIRVSPNRVMFRYADIKRYARYKDPARPAKEQQKQRKHFRARLTR
jgi:predicted DNA-binding transcriptional regulator AlpA